MQNGISLIFIVRFVWYQNTPNCNHPTAEDGANGEKNGVEMIKKKLVQQKTNSKDNGQPTSEHANHPSISIGFKFHLFLAELLTP